MASLREIKDRIGSVKSTLKITSAMKLVASSKLRKAQKAIETLRPYESALCDILTSLAGSDSASAGSSPLAPSHFVGPSPYPGAGMPVGDDSRVGCGTAAETSVEGSACGGTVTARGLVNGRGPSASLGGMERSGSHAEAAPFDGGKAAVVVLSSNSSLCGGFNGNVVKKALELVKECGGDVDVFAVGRRGADALRKAGYPSDDWSELVGRPSYKSSSRLAGILSDAFFDGKYSRVLLVYNHFVTTAHQEVVVEQYLPLVSGSIAAAVAEDDDYYIIEPGKEDVLEELVPKVLTLKFHAAVLDSAAAEHAARTVAMQTATDNAQELLDELTLEYNKGRQQKITSEILDLLGGRTE